MKEFKIVKEEYKDNITYITIATPAGHFTGTAKLHPDDEYSSFAGAEIAEMRAIVKYFKYKAKISRIEINTLKNYAKEFSKTKNYIEGTNKTLYRIIRRIENEHNIYSKNVISLTDKIKKDIIKRDNILNKMNKKSEE